MGLPNQRSLLRVPADSSTAPEHSDSRAMKVYPSQGLAHTQQSRCAPDSQSRTSSRVLRPSNVHGFPCPEKYGWFPGLLYGWTEDRKGCRLPPGYFSPDDELPAAELLFVPRWRAMWRSLAL